MDPCSCNTLCCRESCEVFLSEKTSSSHKSEWNLDSMISKVKLQNFNERFLLHYIQLARDGMLIEFVTDKERNFLQSSASTFVPLFIGRSAGYSLRDMSNGMHFIVGRMGSIIRSMEIIIRKLIWTRPT